MHTMSARHPAAHPHHHFQHAASAPLIEHRVPAPAAASTSPASPVQGPAEYRQYLAQPTQTASTHVHSPRSRSPMYGPSILHSPSSPQQPPPLSTGGALANGAGAGNRTPHAHAHSPRPPPSPAPTTTPRTPATAELGPVVTTAQLEYSENSRQINQYLIGRRVGKGQHGEVYQGYDSLRNNMVVVRITPSSTYYVPLHPSVFAFRFLFHWCDQSAVSLRSSVRETEC